jgi:hypothetical protein
MMRDAQLMAREALNEGIADAALVIADEQVLWWRTCGRTPANALATLRGRPVEYATWGEVRFAVALAWMGLRPWRRK